jgi:uncharacterized cupin superfamily protein
MRAGGRALARPFVNLDDVPTERMRHGARFDATIARVGTFLGARRLGYSCVEIAPGMRACPFHVHHGVEEMFLILSGRGRLRFGDESFAVRAGDCICARAGEAPHQLENDSDEPLRFLAVSSIAATDVVEYPDSEKVGYDIGDGTVEPPRSQYLRRGRVVDYWDGEG